jgi:hypothetical protein
VTSRLGAGKWLTFFTVYVFRHLTIKQRWGRFSPLTNLKFIGPQMALVYRLDAISQGPKNSRIPGLNTLPLALVMDAARIKNIMHGAV